MSIPDPENSPVKEKPWKYLGYPQYSRQIALSDDYQIFRKFAILHTRVALALQDEIVVLETRLDEIDVETSTVEADDIHNGSFRFETRKDRAQLIREIKGKLVEYDSFLAHSREMLVQERPPKHSVKSVKNWLYNNHGPITSAEVDYLDRVGDLIALVPNTDSLLRRLLEHTSFFRRSRLWRTEAPHEVLNIDDAHFTYYGSGKTVDLFLSIVTLTCGLAMLIAPLWILHALQNETVQLSVITVCVSVFVGVLSLSTRANAFESLAAGAAYCAVLVVFLRFS